MYKRQGYKTHCKTCLVVRREDDGKLRRYVHLGTGNYNSKTAKCYTDISLFTANAEIAAEMHISVKTVEAQMSKALRRLRSLLHKE